MNRKNNNNQSDPTKDISTETNQLHRKAKVRIVNKKPTLTPFGRWMRAYRIGMGMLLKDMADLLGYGSAYVSDMELGKREVTEEYLEKCRDALHLDEGTYLALRHLAGR